MACDRLLAHRVEVKVQGRRINDVLNRIHVAQVRGFVGFRLGFLGFQGHSFRAIRMSRR